MKFFDNKIYILSLCIPFLVHRKLLYRFNLIARQNYMEQLDEHTHNGILLHLTRFYTEFKPPHMIVTEQIVDLLKTQPNCMIAYEVLKKSVGSAANTLRKLLKFQQLQKFIVAASVSKRFFLYKIVHLIVNN